MIEITRDFIDIGRLRPAVERNSFNAVVLHEKQGGRGEDAIYFARLAKTSKNVNRLYSSHYYVDDKNIIYVVPEEEIAVHDSAELNNTTIAVTMCVYSGCDYETLLVNVEDLVFDILSRNGIKLVGDSLVLSEDTATSKLVSENLYGTIAKHLQMKLLANNDGAVTDVTTDNCDDSGEDKNEQEQTTEVSFGERVGEPKDPDIRVNEGIYPPADTEDESLDYLELEKYMNLT